MSVWTNMLISALFAANLVVYVEGGRWWNGATAAFMVFMELRAISTRGLFE